MIPIVQINESYLTGREISCFYETRKIYPVPEKLNPPPVQFTSHLHVFYYDLTICTKAFKAIQSPRVFQQM
jgi:hypothetical protein